jgi:pyruvate/2-oxoglutarate dehydrogenase complex dihydrolipoamide acyltransferase (E2) component
MKATWKPHEKHGKLSAQSDLPDSVYAFPKQRKEPLTDARHVRNAIARFDQVIDVSDADRELAFANIKKAATYYGVRVTEKSWHDLAPGPKKAVRKPAKQAAKRSAAAPRKGAKTKRKPTSRTKRKTASRRKST